MVRFGFLGTEGPLARATLTALLQGGAAPDFIIALGLAPEMATPSSPFAITTTPSLAALALNAGVPVLHCPKQETEITALVTSQPSRPELMVVACLPIILHAATYESVPHGFVNVHPSLLPAFRGPQPAFWQLHDGCSTGGVSVHQVDAGVDTGNVLLQQEFALAPGTTEQALDYQAGETAGALLARNLTRWPPLESAVRPSGPSSYQGAPDASAFEIDARSWSADRAYRFISGTAWRGAPYTVRGDRWIARVDQVLEQRLGWVPTTPRVEGRTCTLPFGDAALVTRGELL